MAGRCAVLFLFFLMAAAQVVLGSQGAPACRRIDAAFNFNFEYGFAIGKKLITLDDELNFKGKSRASRNALPSDLTAATSNGQTLFLISGSNDANAPPNGNQILHESDLEEAFGGKDKFRGVDAAVCDINLHFVYFSGCHFIVVPGAGKPTAKVSVRKNSDVGLPCNLDAAVFHNQFESIVAIKGDQAWISDGQGADLKYDGPVPVTQAFRGLSKIKNLCHD